MNTKRKVKDYIGQNVAIYCSSKEEWDKIVDLFDSPTVKKHYWEDVVNLGKSDTISITGRGWSPKEYFIKKQYTIYPASDFLEEESFKFNIGDEIKAKPGGYYIFDPKFFVESHKKQFPSSESVISGKITERTQAQGFNWYRCRYGDNWITEEGVKLVKEDIPEYDECIKTSKSLVGRYVKALRNINILKKGDYDLILSEDPTLFQCEKSLSWSKSRFEEGDFELMPEGFKPEDDLISEAKRRYPLGTKFRPAHILSNTSEYCIVTEDSIFEKDEDQIVLTVNGQWWIGRGNLKYGNTSCGRCVYYKGKWAEIVSDEPEINTYSLKVGDTLKQEIINAWAYIEGNFCTDVQTGWVDVFCRYSEDRKIEDFRDIDGQIGFHVSGCTEGTHYLKAEGFKEFADNFYKKEEKVILEMLPYPKDNYFKAVVVKDIHKKDIETKGDMPDLIPKGYQTWFRDVGTNRERIFQNKCTVCPESNRWRDNIPAEYFQIVEDEKHNDIPEKEWVPQVGEYIVYNNTDVLKVTKVEPCKSYRYWISHTPNSFSGGGFGWNSWKHNIKKATLQEIESIVHTLTDEEILEVCKQFYPKGAKFNNCVNNAGIFTCKGNYKFGENKNVSVSIEEINKDGKSFGCIYYHGKFAKIISSPTQKEAKSWVQKQEEMLDDAIKQHPLTPTECYSSNEIIIPQVIKAQKTIQKIIIESPTELDLKLKTIKPKQIQTIKI